MNLLSCTLRYLPPRSVLICQSFHHPHLAYFATPLIKGEEISERFVKNVTPSSPRKILKDLAKMSHSYLMLPYKIFWTYRVFWKFWSKGNNALLPPDHTPPTSSPNINIRMWEYVITILCTIAFVRFIRIISWVLTMWLISTLPLYKAMKRFVFQFLIWKP